MPGSRIQPLLDGKIELDDASHRKAESVERDRFVERVFGVAELPLMRVIPLRQGYGGRGIGRLGLCKRP